MTNLEWLLAGDQVIERLTKKYLLDENTACHRQGYIGEYLQRYDPGTKKWGNGFYGPKWISTNYTLLELHYMEIEPDNPVYQESLKNYLEYFFTKHVDPLGITVMDLCMSGMFIGLLSYGNIHDTRLDVMIDYVLGQRMPDGAWNCEWNLPYKPKISSVHTTINVLEGLQAYVENGYRYRVDEVGLAIENAIGTLLGRQLICKKGTGTPIHPSIVGHHYPPRWKYDYLRILEFLARKKHPYHPDMQPALDVLTHHMKNGRLTKGTTIPGRLHFPLETGKYGRFNTLRAYIVLRQYAPEQLKEVLYTTVP